MELGALVRREATVADATGRGVQRSLFPVVGATKLRPHCEYAGGAGNEFYCTNEKRDCLHLAQDKKRCLEPHGYITDLTKHFPERYVPPEFV